MERSIMELPGYFQLFIFDKTIKNCFRKKLKFLYYVNQNCLQNKLWKRGEKVGNKRYVNK